MNKVVRFLVAGGKTATVLAVLATAACGWRLQGTAQLPPGMRSVQLATKDVHSTFYRELRRQLTDAGVQVRDEGADAVVRVGEDKHGQRLLSVSARNSPEQYEVFYTVRYSLEIAGKQVLALQSLELTNSYSYDSNLVLAKQREQQAIEDDLSRELAGLVLRRLASLAVSGQAPDTAK
jgi:LPS-assembly lipoprotein